MSSVATDGKDEHGLKLEIIGPTCSSINAMPTKLTKGIVIVSAHRIDY